MPEDCLVVVPPFYERRANRIVAYDLDGTLIRPKDGRVRPRNRNDWELVAPSDTLRAEHARGDTLVIVTNQSSLKTPDALEAFVKEKLQKVVAEIGVPVCMVVCGGYGVSRKPKTSGWRKFLQLTGFDKPDVTYVGDAAGRVGDFADTDLKFAINIGARFHTPEEHFLGHVLFPRVPKFNPHIHMHHRPNPDPPEAFFARGGDRDVVLMCGLPGSGKSAWVRKHAPKHYQVISRDVLKTKDKCVKAMHEAFAQGKSVLVDNAFVKESDRLAYAEPALAAGASAVRVVHMRTNPELAKHLNAMRSEHPIHSKPHVPPLAVRMMSRQFTCPKVGKHIFEVYDVPFCFDKDETDPDLFTQFHH